MLLQPLNFLEASRILKELPLLEKAEINLLSSISLHQLELYLKAEAARRSKELVINTIPFGTLQQRLLSKKMNPESDILFLFPWDFLGALDWRTGIIEKPILFDEIENQILDFKKMLESNRLGKNIFYLPAPLPPVAMNKHDLAMTDALIQLAVCSIGATQIKNHSFCFKTLMLNGCPISSKYLGEVGFSVMNTFFNYSPESKKVLVTDLDETLWQGILGEDGVDGISADPNGSSFKHFIYQTLLKKLKNSGFLIAICSKNDIDLVEKALQTKNFQLNEDDFVSIHASYRPKSDQIKELANSLNLGLEHFVFVDDNPVEIQEVSQSIPEITSYLFPKDLNELHSLINKIDANFLITKITNEDKNRTELYKNIRNAPLQDIESKTDLASFLASLKMKICLFDRSDSDQERAIQLINKTNQFNLNGERVSEDLVRRTIKLGGKLYTASLSDINGDHGEIICLLTDKNNCVISFVMSCRVFQRRVEFIFLKLILKNYLKEIHIRFIKTERNEPIKIFLLSLFPNLTDEMETIDLKILESASHSSVDFYSFEL